MPRKFGSARAALSQRAARRRRAVAGRARASFNGCFMTASLALGFDLSFDDLHSRDGLARLDTRFLAFLGERDGELKGRLEAARADPASVKGDAESELLIALAPVLEDFIGALFGVEGELGASRVARADL